MPRQRTGPLCLILIFVLLGTMGTAASLQAGGWNAAYGNETSDNIPEWVPPTQPPGADLSTETYLLMWNGMETIPGSAADAIGSEYTTAQAYKVIAAREDAPKPAPPRSQVEWNTNTDETLDESSRTKSRFPPGTDRTDGEFIKDAYLRLGAVTPSTVYHRDGDRITLAGENGNVLVASDFRTTVPAPRQVQVNNRSYRATYEFVNTSVGPVNITAQNPDSGDGTEIIHEKQVNSTGGTLVPYEDLDGKTSTGEVKLVIKQNVSTAVQRTLQREECENNGSRGNASISCEYVNVSTDIIVENVTVQDEAVVVRRTNTAQVEMRAGPETTYVRLEGGGTWSSVTAGPSGNRSILSNERGFVTKRDHHWDTFVTATASGTSDPYYHPFTPVETHAFPAYDGARAFNPVNSASKVTVLSQETGPAKAPYNPQPRNVNVTTATEPGYRQVQSVTAELELDAQRSQTKPVAGANPDVIRVNSYVYDQSVTEQVTHYEPTRQANLTIRMRPVYENESSLNPSYYDITAYLSDAETGDPIETEGTNRTIRIIGHETIETNESGIATKEGSASNYSFTGIVAVYMPQGPFESELHYTEAVGTDNGLSKKHRGAVFGYIWNMSAYIVLAITPGILVVLITYIVFRRAG